jgi:hypothetical protein
MAIPLVIGALPPKGHVERLSGILRPKDFALAIGGS